jgi:hypothetical protein
VAESCDEVIRVFETLLVQCRSPGSPRILSVAPSLDNVNKQSSGFTIRRFSVSRMLTSLIGGSNKNQNVTANNGTVVVCQPADLYKNKLVQRRQNAVALWDEKFGHFIWTERVPRTKVLVGTRRVNLGWNFFALLWFEWDPFDKTDEFEFCWISSLLFDLIFKVDDSHVLSVFA